MVAEEHADLDFRDCLRALRRRRWTIVLVVLVAVSVALVKSYLTTPVYQGTAKVLLQPRSTDTLFNPATGQRNDPTRAVDTEIQVLKSEPVRAAVKEKLGMAPPVSAAPVGQTDVIGVSAQSANPRAAAAIANTYAQAYIDFRRKQAVDDLMAASQEIESKVAQFDKQIADADAQLANAPVCADPKTTPVPCAQRDSIAARVQAQRTALLDQQGVFKQRLDQVQVDADLTTGRAQMVAPAAVPTTPVKPTPLRTGILGLVVGLVLGGGLALLREYLDDSINSKEDLEKAARGLPVVGLIPVVSGWKDKEEPRVVSVLDPRSPTTEAYRTLRTSLQFLTMDHPLRTLLVTSPGAQEGKTTTLANLGVALASAGQRVVIVCCDLRRPRIHEFFGLTNTVGLTSVLVGEAALSDALQAVPGAPGLSLLASGALPPNPAELLSSRRVGEVLEALQAHAGTVLIDSPPVLPVTDALVLSKRVDATLLTCYAGATTRKEVRRATELLCQVDSQIVGTVLNGVGVGDRYGYGYYYSRYYRSAEGDTTPSAATNGNGQAQQPKEPEPTA